MKNKFPIS